MGEKCKCECGGEIPENLYWPGMDKVVKEYYEQKRKKKLQEDAKA